MERGRERDANRDERVRKDAAEGFRSALVAEANLARRGFTLVSAATAAGMVVVSFAAQATPLAAWLLGAFLVAGVTLAAVILCRLRNCCDRDELKALGDPHGAKRTKIEVTEQGSVAMVGIGVTIIIGLFALLVVKREMHDQAVLAITSMTIGGGLGLLAVFWIVWHSLDQLTSKPKEQPGKQLPRAMP